MAAEIESGAQAAATPAPAPAAAAASGRGGRGRGGRGGRGRGRGGGRGGASSTTTANVGIAKPAASARGGRGGTRRGRAKTFPESRVQAAYERQRDLKSLYQSVAAVLKPALQELADRSIEELMSDPDAYKRATQYLPLVAELDQRLESRLNQISARVDLDQKLAEKTYEAEQEILHKTYEDSVNNLLERFYDGQLERLRILEILHSRGLPVDIEDDQYQYKVISDEHFDKEFGIYESYLDGHLVPYPSRIEGTEMWQKARDTEAAAASAAAAAASANTTSSTSSAANSGGTRGRGRGRGGVKRRATDQPEGQSTPKRSTRNTDDSSQLLHSLSMAPAPAKGLLASAAEADLPPEGTPAEDESPSGSPEPTNLANGSAPSASQTKQQGKVHAREKSPALPKNVAEPDDFGVRIYNQRPSFRDKGLNSRLLAPSCLVFDDLDIGFRDSSNDSSKGHTRTKRGKYLDTPNSNGFHFDHWCNGFDYSTTKAGDFNKALVKRHSVHPTYGVFLPGSTNEQEDQTTLIMPGKPVVFIANPSGRISHASRGYQQTANHNRLVDSPWRHKMGASLRRFCKVDGDTDPQDIDITDRLASDDELRERSLGTALKELETRATGSDDSSDIDMEAAGESEEAIASRDAAEEVRPDLSSLTYAAAFIEASEAPRATPAPPKPANAKYDAVRDMFVSEAEPPAVQLPVQQETVALNFLADLCNSTPRNLMLAPLREDDAVDNFVRPAPPLPPPAMSEYELPPVLSERESSYVPPTPTQSIRDIMQEAPEPTLQSLPPRAPSLPPPPMHHQHQHQQQPLHHYVREESGPYLPHARQSTHASHSEASHYGQDYAASTHAPLPPVAPGPAPAQEYPPSQQHHYAQSPLENGYAQPLPHNGYSVAEMQPQSQHPPSHSYEHSLNHRPMSSFAPNDNPYARTAWSQHPPPPPPPPGPLAHSSVSMQTPAPSHGYPSQPPPINTPRPSFSHHPVGEPLPPLRPPRGRHQSMPPSIYDESLVDPSLRSGPPPPLNGYGNYYPAPSHGYQHNYGPAEQQHHSYQHRHSDRILPAPQQPPPHHQGYMASPPPPSHAYHASIPSPTMGSMQLGGQGMSPQDPPHHHAFHHRSTGSGSGAGLPPPGDANSKYRKLQPAPIPAHRNWSSNKPELKTIPYDHKDSTGVSGAAALPNSGPTTIRGWNVNPQRRRPRSDRRENADAVNERDDSR